MQLASSGQRREMLLSIPVMPTTHPLPLFPTKGNYLDLNVNHAEAAKPCFIAAWTLPLAFTDTPRKPSFNFFSLQPPEGC